MQNKGWMTIHRKHLAFVVCLKLLLNPLNIFSKLFVALLEGSVSVPNART